MGALFVPKDLHVTILHPLGQTVLMKDFKKAEIVV